MLKTCYQTPRKAKLKMVLISYINLNLNKIQFTIKINPDCPNDQTKLS